MTAIRATSRWLRPLVVACSAASAARAQEKAAEQSPFVVDARSRSQRFALEFKLGEEGRSTLCVELSPDGDESPRLLRELSLRFDPFEGAHWHWTVRPQHVAPDTGFDAAMRSATSTPLTQIPEPKELLYRLDFDFHAGGGLSVAFPDGTPLLAARFGGQAPLRVAVRSGGAVTTLSVSAIETGGDPALADALAATDAGLAPWNLPAPPAPTETADFSRATLTPFEASAEPLHAVRPIAPIEAPEGLLSRFILEARDRVEVPTLLVEPRRLDPTRPVVVLACGAPFGKASTEALRQLVERVSLGHAVVAFDLLGGGERRVNQSFDPGDLPELELVGSSTPAVALEELRQVVAWAAALPAAANATAPTEPRAIELLVDAAAAELLSGAAGSPSFESAGGPTRSDLRASATLADAAVFGEEYLRARYDSDLYHRAVQLRETCERADATPLAERVAAAAPPVALEGMTLLEFDPATARVAALDLRTAERSGAARAALALSDFGPRAALQLARATAAHPDERILGAGGGATGADRNGATLGAMAHFVGAALAQAAGRARPDGAAPRCRVRLVAEGEWALPALLAAFDHPERVDSLTVFRALPSFELLLRRPPDAVRAESRFDLLSQGAPRSWFVPGAFSRFEIEELALALRAAAVPIDWRDPVDALRRPLDRHGRRSMWPRLRRQEQAPLDR
jgi:hypothetical protein